MSGKKKHKGTPHAPKSVVNTEKTLANKERSSFKTRPIQTVKKKGIAGFINRNPFQIVLFLLCFLVFGNGIFNEYALDDEFYTAGSNKLTQQGIKGIPKIFTTRTFFNNDGSGYSYRPVALASFAIEIQFFGEKPHVSHFINILLYALTIVLIFGILRKWFATQGDWFSFFVCLIFLVHPLHTEVVDNIKCRDELLAMLFAILSVRYIWQHVETKKIIYLFLAALCFFLGMLAKHTIIPFLVILPLALWYFTETKWKTIIMYVVILMVAAAATSLLQKALLPAQFREYQEFENPLPVHNGFGEHTATSLYVLGRYLLLHFFPHPLVYYYGFQYIPIVNWTNPIALISLVVYAAMGVLVLKGIRNRSLLAFGLLFYLVNIAAYSNLLQPAPGLMAERFTYAASLGFCIVLVWGIFQFTKIVPLDFRWKADSSKRTRTILLLLALVFTARSWVRNEDWEDKMTLYSHDIVYTHESAKANMLLGALISVHAMDARMQARGLEQQQQMGAAQQKTAESQQLFMEARGYYKKATEVAPYYHTAWSNLGTTYFFLDDPLHALPYFKKAVSLNKHYTEGLFNAGMAYDKLNKKDSAIWYFQEAIHEDSTYVSAYEQLSRIRFQQENNKDEALRILKLAAKKKPDSEVPWNNIANIYLQLKDTASSAGAMEMAARINPSNVTRLYNLAMYFKLHNDFEKYNDYYSRYLEQDKIQREKQKAGAIRTHQ